MSEVQNQTTDIALLPPAERAAIVLDASKAEKQLKELVEEAKGITEVKDKTDREMAHRVAMKLRTARTSIEKIGKAARDDATAFNKAVIDTEKRLKAITAEEEERIFSLRDAFDKAEEEKKAAAARAEEARIAGIKTKIEAFRRLPFDSANDTPEELQATIDDLGGIVITHDEFAEFAEEANTVVGEIIAVLSSMLDTAKAKAAAEAALAEERAKLAAERAEIERERAELEALRRERAALEASNGQAAVTAADTVAAETSTIADKLMGSSVEVVGYDISRGEGQTVILAKDEVGAIQELPLDHPAAQEVLGTTADNDDATDADAIVPQIAHYTAMQFHAFARKVAAAGAGAYASELRAIGDRLLSGEFNEAILAADWTAMGEADKDIALAAHACVALIFGDEVAGPSVMLQLEAGALQAAE